VIRSRLQASLGGAPAKPQLECSEGDRAVEDLCPFLISGGHGPEAFERQDGSLHFVSAGVPSTVEAGGATAVASPASAVGLLCPRLGDGVLDLAAAQVTSVSAGGVRPIGSEVVGPGAGVATARTGTRMRSRAGIIWGASPHCPGVMSSASGRHRPSLIRWTLVVSPPRGHSAVDTYPDGCPPPCSSINAPLASGATSCASLDAPLGHVPNPPGFLCAVGICRFSRRV